MMKLLVAFFLIFFCIMAGADTPPVNLQFTSPLIKTGNTISCQVASGSQAGCLSATDYSRFDSGGGGANLTLSNLGSTAINADIIPGSTGKVLGSGSIPWATVWTNELLAPGQIDFELTTGFVYNSTGSHILDLNNLLFEDNSENKSGDWQNRQLSANDGSTIMFEWSTAGVLNAHSNLISNVLDPVSTQDAATKNYVDTHSGSSGANTTLSNLSATTAINVNLLPGLDGDLSLGSPSAYWGPSYINQFYDSSNAFVMDVFARKLYLNASTPMLDWSVDGTIDMEGNSLSDLDDPTNPQDAATKNYVDTHSGGGGAPSHTSAYSLFEDFSTGFYSGNGNIYADHTWATLQSGAPTFTGSSSGTPIQSDSSHPGVMVIGITSAGDGGGITAGNFQVTTTTSFVPGNGQLSIEMLINIQTLSNSTDNGELNVGFIDAPAWAAPSNGAWFNYEIEEATPNWICNTMAASAFTSNTSAIPVTTGWHHLKVVIDATGANASFYVDTVLACTNATNIPSVVLPPMISYRKTLGSSVLYIGIDYIDIEKTFTTPR